MNAQDIARRRMASQQIIHSACKTPAEVVQWLGAVQAQDYLGALWAVGLRVPGATEQTVEDAIAAKQIVRTWPMRGTIHFVAPADARWMIELLTPRVVQRTRSRSAELGIDDAVVAKSTKLLSEALAGGKCMSRPELYTVLEAGGIAAGNSRGLHILGRLSHDLVLCFGPRAGKQPTFTLFEEWLPDAKSLPKDEAVARLALRYFASHGPATIQDFMWWSGLTTAEAKAGIAGVSPKLAHETVDGQEYYFDSASAPDNFDKCKAHLLPPFDEYLVAYRDRSASLDKIYSQHVTPGGNGIFNPIVVIDGQVLGTWKRTFKKDSVIMAFAPFTSFTGAQREAIAAAAEPYGTFVGKTVVLE